MGVGDMDVSIVQNFRALFQALRGLYLVFTL
jgi:hypothetical protein